MSQRQFSNKPLSNDRKSKKSKIAKRLKMKRKIRLKNHMAEFMSSNKILEDLKLENQQEWQMSLYNKYE